VTDEGSPPRRSHRPAPLLPETVKRRLDRLRQIAVVERDDHARARLAGERQKAPEPFAVAVERRLRELRALTDLAAYVHGGRRG
jgi:hypothetical protein